MSTQTDARPTVRYTLTCPSWCTADHHRAGDGGSHERVFPVPALDTEGAVVLLTQSSWTPEREAEPVASVACYLLEPDLTPGAAAELAAALTAARCALQAGVGETRRVEVVHVLTDLVAVRDAQGGPRVAFEPPAGTGGRSARRAVLVWSADHGLVLYAFEGSAADVLAAAGRAIEDPSSAAWEWAEGEWRVRLSGVTTEASA